MNISRPRVGLWAFIHVFLSIHLQFFLMPAYYINSDLTTLPCSSVHPKVHTHKHSSRYLFSFPCCIFQPSSASSTASLASVSACFEVRCCWRSKGDYFKSTELQHIQGKAGALKSTQASTWTACRDSNLALWMISHASFQYFLIWTILLAWQELGFLLWKSFWKRI